MPEGTVERYGFTMKIKNGFILRKVSDAYVVIATGEAAVNFNGMISLNETGALIWEKLAEGCDSKKVLVDALLEEYDVSEELAAKDVDGFVAKIEAAGILV